MRAIYKRYFGNTGRVQQIPEQPRHVQPMPPAPPPPPPRAPQRGAPCPMAQKQPAVLPRGGRPGGLLGSLTSRLDLSKLETEDLILLLILYLLYRESGDEELLIMMGAMLFL